VVLSTTEAEAMMPEPEETVTSVEPRCTLLCPARLKNTLVSWRKRAGSMEFIVVGDGRELWRSGPIFQKAAGAAFSINLAGVRELRLVVTDGGNGNAEDWGAWLNLEVGR